jgi:hypothetical protein
MSGSDAELRLANGTSRTIGFAGARSLVSGGVWKLIQCSAVLDVQVYILAGLFPAADSYAHEYEQQHVTDYENGAQVIADAGIAMEQYVRKDSFSSQTECENRASDAVTRALRKARDQIAKISAQKWDESHRHDIWRPKYSTSH